MDANSFYLHHSSFHSSHPIQAYIVFTGEDEHFIEILFVYKLFMSFAKQTLQLFTGHVK